MKTTFKNRAKKNITKLKLKNPNFIIGTLLATYFLLHIAYDKENTLLR